MGQGNIMDKTLAECWNMKLGDIIKMVSKEISANAPATEVARVVRGVILPQASDLKMEVSEILRELGVPANIKGYTYLRDAIIYALEEPKALGGITKILYPEVAKMNDTTGSRTERAIRHAIEVAWERGNIDVIESYFGSTIDMKRDKPTNSNFIAVIVDHLRLKYNLS